MRWIASLFIVILLASCNSMKPAIGKSGESSNGQAAVPTRFIDHITIYPAGSKSIVDKTSNNSSINTYNKSNESIATSSTVTVNNYAYISPLQIKYAILMDVAVEELTNFKLLSFMEDWYGTNYRFGGNDKDGIDCSAFSCNLMSTVFGIELPRMAKDQFKATRRIHKKKLVVGDLVFFHTTRKGVSHVGIYLGNQKFVHASVNYGVTISDLKDPYYARTFIGAGRMKPNANTASAGN